MEVATRTQSRAALVALEGPAKSADSTAILVAFIAGTYLTGLLLRGTAVVLILSGSSTAGAVLDGFSVIVFGPAFVALLLTGLYAGKAGVRQLLVGLLPQRSAWQWYVLALTIPVAAAYVAIGINVAFGAPYPDSWFPRNWSFLLGLLAFQLLLLTPGEEIGWRAFALPRLQKRLGSLGGTLILATLWLGWHTPLFFMVGTAQVSRSVLVYGLTLLAWSLIMTWLYNNSGGNTLTAVLFHTSANVVGFTLPFDAGLTVLLVLLLLGCSAILFYPRPLLLLRAPQETQDSTTNVKAAGGVTISEEASNEKTQPQGLQRIEGGAREISGHSGETLDIYRDAETAKEDEGDQGGFAGVLEDAFGNARRGKLPRTGYGRAVLLVVAAALIGGGWLLMRRSSASG